MHQDGKLSTLSLRLFSIWPLNFYYWKHSGSLQFEAERWGNCSATWANTTLGRHQWPFVTRQLVLSDRKLVFPVYDDQSDFDQQVQVLTMDFTLFYFHSYAGPYHINGEIKMVLRLFFADDCTVISESS
jgi:hypothetical protein